MIRTNKYLKLLTFMSVGALGYGLIEVAARGFTHISMGLLGGLCFCFIGFTGALRRSGRLTLMQQLFVTTLFITTSELLCGLIENLLLGMNIWDYSAVPLNYKGQICLPFSALWFMLSYFATLTDAWIRRHIFREKPYQSENRHLAESEPPVLTNN